LSFHIFENEYRATLTIGFTPKSFL